LNALVRAILLVLQLLSSTNVFRCRRSRLQATVKPRVSGLPTTIISPQDRGARQAYEVSIELEGLDRNGEKTPGGDPPTVSVVTVGLQKNITLCARVER
jgi:hypothetical protein